MRVNLHTAAALGRYKAGSPSEVVDIKEGADLTEMLNQGIATPAVAKGKGGDPDAANAEKRAAAEKAAAEKAAEASGKK